MTDRFRLRATSRRLLVAAVAMVAATACASAGGGASQERSTPSGSRYLITEAELEKVQADNLYDAINKLRPDFLRGRGENASFVQQSVPKSSKEPASSAPASSSAGSASLTATNPVMVYKDNVRMSGVEELRQLQPATIREIRFLPGPEASIRFGTNNSSGAILITSK
jgi:hypothetical protein